MNEIMAAIETAVWELGARSRTNTTGTKGKILSQITKVRKWLDMLEEECQSSVS